MDSQSFQPFGNVIENFSIRYVGSIKARGVKENQAIPTELWTIRSGIDDYWQRLCGTRAHCAVPDFCDIFTHSNVDELGTVKLNDWIVAIL